MSNCKLKQEKSKGDFMVRIIWGVIFVLLGLFMMGQAIVAVAMLQAASQITGHGSDITSKMMADAGIFPNFVLCVVLCFLGSLMIYFGDRARKEGFVSDTSDSSFDSNKPDKGHDW
jgi:Na+/phosphate symporter